MQTFQTVTFVSSVIVFRSLLSVFFLYVCVSVRFKRSILFSPAAQMILRLFFTFLFQLNTSLIFTICGSFFLFLLMHPPPMHTTVSHFNPLLAIPYWLDCKWTSPNEKKNQPVKSTEWISSAILECHCVTHCRQIATIPIPFNSNCLEAYIFP